MNRMANKEFNSIINLPHYRTPESIPISRGAVDDKGVEFYGDKYEHNVNGTYVYDLQCMLKSIGANIKPDGVFGRKTEAASKKLLGVSEFAFKEDCPDLLFAEKIKGEDSPSPIPKRIEQIINNVSPLPSTAKHEDPPEEEHSALPDNTASPAGNIVSNVPHYCQADPRWGDRILGNKRTFRKSGCAVTCCAMLVSHILREEILPSQLDEYLDVNGGYQGDSLVWPKVCDFAKTHGSDLNYNRVQGSHDDLKEMAKKEIVSSGQPVMLRVRYNKDNWNLPFNHFVLAVGTRDDKEIVFHDPGYKMGSAYEDDMVNSTSQVQRKDGYTLVALEIFKKQGNLIS